MPKKPRHIKTGRTRSRKFTRALIQQSFVGKEATARPVRQHYVVSKDRLKRFYHVIGQRRERDKRNRVVKVDIYERLHKFRFKHEKLDFKVKTRDQTLYRKVEFDDRVQVVRSKPLADMRIKTYYIKAPGYGFFIRYPDAMAVDNGQLFNFLTEFGLNVIRRNKNISFFRFEGGGESEDTPTFNCGGYMNHDLRDAVASLLDTLDAVSFRKPYRVSGLLMTECKVSIWSEVAVIEPVEYQTLFAKRD